MGSGLSSRTKRKANQNKNQNKSQPNENSKIIESTQTPQISSINIVEEAWKKIESQELKPSVDESKINQIGWREIRVFVSSTFSDMHNEREILVKKVFPELRDWCEERKLCLTECDLRWGIPKDTTSNTTISVCLEEIDRCYEENNGTPYFINMLSERYGWMPALNEISSEVIEKYEWVENISITHMEILHGAYRRNNPNAFFCLRDPGFVSSLPQQHLNKFIETDELPISHLKVLKKKLQDKFLDRCVTYDCQVSGVDKHTGREKVKLIGLEDFGQKVLNFLREAIAKQYLVEGSNVELGLDEQEEIIHQRATSLHASFVTGRIKELEALNAYVGNGVDSDIFVSEISNKEEKVEGSDINSNENKILCISGIPGIGKSSILCKSANNLIEKGVKVLFHYVGCTTTSCDWRAVVKRIIQLYDPNEKIDEDEKLLLEKMKSVMKKLDNDIVLFICKLENMYNSDSVNCLEWLPARFPDKIRCVVSVDSNNYICMDRLKTKDCHFLKLDNFSKMDASLFVQEYLLKYNKKLDEEQMNNFLSKESSTFPLWLKVASEELRVFGDFVTLSNKIDSFPGNLRGLVKEVIDRLIREDETSLMEKLLCLMLCTKSGLPESEISKLLGEPKTGTESPSIVWATIRRYLKPFIVETRFYKTSKVKFMHEAFTQAAKELLLNEESSQKWNKYLADYFEFYNKNEIYLWDDLAHNLIHSGCWKRLAKFYRTDTRTFAMNAMFRSQLLSKIRCKQSTFSPDSCKVIICTTCSTKSRLISVLPNMTKDLCQICGAWVAFKNDNNIARLCIKHRTHFNENFKKCFHCNQAVMASKPIYMQLCNHCKVGNNCSYLLEGSAD